MEYYIIISASIIIIFSHLFNRLSRRTNIPSVLLLIAGGILAREIMLYTSDDYEGILASIKKIKLIELLGTLGLIMIVLEAALDLKLTRDKLPLIFRALISSVTILVGSTFGIAEIIYYALADFTFIQSMIYATPLSILSSAIVIPSVANLRENRKEFHVYDSTFSDIIGIMMFYFLIELSRPSSNAVVIGDFFSGLVITIVISILLSYVLIYIFQSMETKVKLFLMIAVLLLLYSVGKMMHLSSLIIILIFGLILSNPKIFFVGILKVFHNKRVLNEIYEAFQLITMESAFVVRTFFFFIFGFSVSIGALLDFKLAVVSGIIILMIYATRAVLMRLIVKAKDFKLSTLIAPRGLITLLLFYSIPENLVNQSFNGGILLFVIIFTSLLMTYGLIKFGGVKNASETDELIHD